MNDSESSEVTATDRNPAVENAATSGQAEPGTDWRKKGKGCLIAAGVGVPLLVFLAWRLTAPSLIRMGKKDEQVLAIINGKQLIWALNDFATEYGSFPDQETAQAVKERTKTTLDLDGDTANHYFRQLIAAGVTKSEDPFFAKTPYSLKKPDNNMRDHLALVPGEVGFGYLMNGTKSLPGEDPNLVIAATPLLNANATGEFDPEPLDGKAALVFLDTSVQMRTINPTDHRAMLSPTKTLLENGPGTIWGTAITPVIKPPLTQPGWMPAEPRNRRTELAWLLGGGALLAFIAWRVVRRRKRRCEAADSIG